MDYDKKAKIKELKKLLKGKTIYMILRHVSQSGMQRVISFMFFQKYKHGLEPYYLDYDISNLLNYKQSKDYKGIKVNGCGMDMGFSVVANLSEKLYKNYKVLKYRWL